MLNLQGPALVSMLESVITRPVLQQGLRNYFHKKQFRSAEREDVWKFLQAAVFVSIVFSFTLLPTVLHSWKFTIHGILLRISGKLNLFILKNNERFSFLG